MFKPRDPRELAVDLLNRSTCSVQVAAVLADGQGIFSWGWNHVGKGFGTHAEDHCLSRANRYRAKWSTIYVASRRVRKSGRSTSITSRPCGACMPLLKAAGVFKVVWRNAAGEWMEEVIS